MKLQPPQKRLTLIHSFIISNAIIHKDDPNKDQDYVQGREDMAISRKEIVDQVSENLQGEKTTIAKVVDALFETMRQQIIEGNRIEIRGFGTFTVKEMKARPRARNPRTGEQIQVPPRRKIRFVPGKLIKGAFRKQRRA